MATPTATLYGQEVRVPSVEELNIETGGLVCEFEGCSEVFNSSSQLHMHLAKHHRKKPLLKRSGCILYCCPINGCERSKGGKGKPFPRLGQLKQHYQRVHGVKKHLCDKCGKQFSLRDVFSRHIAECGQDISCRICGAKFLTRNALSKHARRKKHPLPSKNATETVKEVIKEKPTTTCFSMPRVEIVVKQVVKLSKQVSVSTQTEEGMAVTEGFPPREISCYKELAHTSESSDIHREGNPVQSLSLQPSSSLDFSTQTEDCYPSSFQSSFDFNDLATQTDFSELLGFGTKCASSQTHLVSNNDSLGQYLSSPSSSSDDSILKAAIGSLNESTTSLRTSEALLNLECVGTQTTMAGTGCYAGLGMATQTSPEDLFCQLDEDSRIDFGTQTMDWLNDISTSVDL